MTFGNTLPGNQMADQPDSVFGRMKEARFQTAVRLRETVSLERMAELVGKALGRPMHLTQWRRYETDREPPLDVIRAAAAVSGLSDAYIAFGSGGPTAIVDSSRDRKLTPAEEQRALRAADERKRPATAPQRTGKRRGAGGE